MLKRGLLTESELSKHVDALADVTDQVVEVELKQPALVKESERVERVVSRSAPRPVATYVPVVRSLENELNDIDDDEDDDLDDEDDEDDEFDEFDDELIDLDDEYDESEEEERHRPGPHRYED